MAISDLHRDRALTAVSLEDVGRLREFLARYFAIEFEASSDSQRFGEALAAAGQKRRSAYERLNLAALERGWRTGQEELEFYKILARQPLFGAVTSQRWSVILDAGCFITAVLRQLPRRPEFILDAGCNAGYHALWMAMEFDSHVVGVDRSPSMLELATATAKQLGIRQRFTGRASMDDLPTLGRRFDAAISVNGAVVCEPESLERLASVMAPNGIVIHVDDSWLPCEKEDMLDLLSGAGFSLQAIDVLGGWDPLGEELASWGVTVWQLGGEHRVSGDLFQINQRWWDDGYREHCNGGRHGLDEMTMAYYRAGSLPPGDAAPPNVASPSV